jgi:uncharacterized protein (DUF362 family)
MKEFPSNNLSDPRVAIGKLPLATYDGSEHITSPLAKALAGVCKALGWSEDERGLLGAVIPEGARVLVKPNFVLHKNEGTGGIDPLVTHASLIRHVVDAALRVKNSEVTVGDAPVQACDFAELLCATGLETWADELATRNPRFKGVRDLRRTTCVFENGVRVADENRISLEHFVLFDLGSDSLLEPVSKTSNPFRVTCYDPRLMAKTHAPGRHQYLIAREVLEADVIINLPKLKTHKKAGITCALKNLIGINGNKEYLPHHRVGGSQTEGDCYPGAGLTKRALEYTLDQQNMAASPAASKLWNGVARNLNRALKLSGDELGVEGSWSGNDTIWRTCLDLNRILLYGRVDGTMGDAPQRRVLHIADAVIAGQGDGPLAPQPLPLGLIFASFNAAAMDYVGAHLLGYEPQHLPVVRHAFANFLWPLVDFTANEVMLAGDAGNGQADEIFRSFPFRQPVIYPVGWRDAARSVES